MMNMEKTERSMADLEIELNQKYGEASMIEEANSKLRPIYGAGSFLPQTCRYWSLTFAQF